MMTETGRGLVLVAARPGSDWRADRAGQGQVAPAAVQGLEVAGCAWLIHLQPALTHGAYHTEHRNEALLCQHFAQLQERPSFSAQPSMISRSGSAVGDSAR